MPRLADDLRTEADAVLAPLLAESERREAERDAHFEALWKRRTEAEGGLLPDLSGDEGEGGEGEGEELSAHAHMGEEGNRR